MIVCCKHCGVDIQVAPDAISGVCPRCTMMTAEALETQAASLEQDIAYYKEKKGQKYKASTPEKKLKQVLQKLERKKDETEAQEGSEGAQTAPVRP